MVILAHMSARDGPLLTFPE